ncbi:hypothetical protein HK105_201274 [Polyrhizophydium stewartii]|uniref:Ankyrin repeat protein n=1 Tax=Polyrhizophydium stewartii TaxID=2732419 RepID=A0ABR4NHR6_9FUNG
MPEPPPATPPPASPRSPPAHAGADPPPPELPATPPPEPPEPPPSHWDRCPLEIKNAIVGRAGTLTKWTAARIDDADLAALHADALLGVWVEAATIAWPGDLALLPRCNRPDSVAVTAAQLGNIRMLEHLIKVRGCSGVLDGAILSAARAGQVETLRWLDAHGGRSYWPSSVLNTAINSSHWETAKFIIERRPRHVDAIQYAASSRNFAILEHLHAEYASRFETKATVTAVMQGHIDVLEWLRAHDVLGDPEWLLVHASERGRMAVVDWVRETIRPRISCGTLAKLLCNKVDQALDWFLGQPGDVLEPSVVDQAAGDINCAMLARLHAAGASCTTAAIDRAAGSGHMDVVCFLHTKFGKGCTTQALTSACEARQTAIVKWLLTNIRDVEWDLPAACKAASEGRVVHTKNVLLKYAKRIGVEITIPPRFPEWFPHQ